MKLLFDQNLPPRLVGILSVDFPGSAHVAELGMDRAADLDLWTFAKENGYCVVTKDSDFGDWAQVFGYPPAVVWLRVGNCSTRDLITKLRAKKEQIARLGNPDEPWVLVII